MGGDMGGGGLLVVDLEGVCLVVEGKKKK